MTTEFSSPGKRGHALDPLTLLRRLPLVRTPAADDTNSPAAAAAAPAVGVAPPLPHEPSPPPEFARSGAAMPLPWWRLTVVDRQMLGQVRVVPRARHTVPGGLTEITAMMMDGSEGHSAIVCLGVCTFSEYTPRVCSRCGFACVCQTAQVATCAAAAIAEPLLGMVDTICIGHLGLLPLAAMAPNNTIFGMINQLATFTLVVTVANKVAMALGAGSKARQLRMMSAEAALNVGNACALGLGVAVAAAFVVCPDPFLNLFGAYPATLGLAREYFQVRLLSVSRSLVERGSLIHLPWLRARERERMRTGKVGFRAFMSRMHSQHTIRITFHIIPTRRIHRLPQLTLCCCLLRGGGHFSDVCVTHTHTYRYARWARPRHC